MEDDTKNMRSNDIANFHVICGISSKNKVSGITPGIIGCGDGKVLDLSRFDSLLVADLDYFIDHKEEIVDLVKGQIEYRDNTLSAKDKST